MKYHNHHFSWLWNRDGERVVLVGFAIGRVSYEPEAKFLYSFRLFLGLFKIEILWKTRLSTSDPDYACKESYFQGWYDHSKGINRYAEPTEGLITHE